VSIDRSISSQVEVEVDAQTAFRAFTEELNLWWVRSPISFFDYGRLVAITCEPGVGGRILEEYESDALELARITSWEPGRRLAWRSSVDDVLVEVLFDGLADGGTRVRVNATIPVGTQDQGGTAWVRTVPAWFGAWCARREGAPRSPLELARLAVGVYYAKPATAARWLCDAFGLTPISPLPETDDYKRAWIEFHVGNCSLLVFRLNDGGAGAPAARPGTHVPWLFVDDLDAHLERSAAHGAEIVSPISQHGYRAYTARDLEGYTWTIAQANPGMR
jgi:uncharacterized glyoxalase superfamily protein PhnB